MLPNKNGYDFNSRLPTKYWNDKTKVEFIQRRIIVYSIMYYELNESVLTDQQFDSISHQLVEYMNTIEKDVLEQTQYYYVFYDFKGETGYYIYDRLNNKDKEYLLTIANHILYLYKSGYKTRRVEVDG